MGDVAGAEYNMMTLMRRRMPEVFEAIHDIRGIIIAAADFEDNPAKEITDRLNRMDSQVRSWTRAVDPQSADGF